MPEVPGRFTPKGLKENPYMTTSWHQGSALFFGSGDGNGQYSMISGNYIEGAAQGMDIHADYIAASCALLRLARAPGKSHRSRFRGGCSSSIGRRSRSR